MYSVAGFHARFMAIGADYLHSFSNSFAGMYCMFADIEEARVQQKLWESWDEEIVKIGDEHPMAVHPFWSLLECAGGGTARVTATNGVNWHNAYTWIEHAAPAKVMCWTYTDDNGVVLARRGDPNTTVVL